MMLNENTMELGGVSPRSARTPLPPPYTPSFTQEIGYLEYQRQIERRSESRNEVCRMLVRGARGRSGRLGDATGSYRALHLTVSIGMILDTPFARQGSLGLALGRVSIDRGRSESLSGICVRILTSAFLGKGRSESPPVRQ